MTHLKTLLSAAILACATFLPAAATTIDVGPQTGTYSGNVRGFWFTAPTDLTITGLDVPTDASTGNIDAAILRLPASPPDFALGGTSTYDILYQLRDSATGVTGLSISVASGDVIGVLGYRGGVNSYGAGAYTTNVLGFPMIIDRFGTQFNLDASPLTNQAVWREASSSISRVNLTVGPGTSLTPIPLPAPLLMLGGGLLALGAVRIRQNAR